MSIQNMIEKITQNDTDGATEAFLDVINTKVIEALDQKREQVARSMFGESMLGDARKEEDNEDDSDKDNDSDEKSAGDDESDYNEKDDNDDSTDDKVKTKKDGKKITVTVDEETELDESSPGYKESGKKMGSRFGMSHKNEKEAVKKGVIPGAAEVKAMGRNPSFSATEWSKHNRKSLRQIRSHEKNLPVYDMDGSYFHEENEILDEADFERTEFGGKTGKYWKAPGEVHGTRKIKGAGYGNQHDTDEDGNEITKPAATQPEVKRGRGRPKKDTSMTSGGKAFSTDAISALLKSKMGALPKGKTRKISGE